MDDKLPARTEEVEFALIPMENLGVFSITFNSDTMLPRSLFDPEISETDYEAIESLSPTTQPIDLLSAESVSAPVPLRFLIKYNYPWQNTPDYEDYPVTNPLSTREVYLRISYYYERIFQHVVQPGVTLTEEASWTEGLSVTEANSFTSTLGVSTEVSVGGDWGPVSAEVSTEVSAEWERTTTHETTITQEETQTQTIEFSPPTDHTYLYAVWQKVEVFEFVDGNGDPWDVRDLGYSYTPIPSSNGRLGFISRIPTSAEQVVTTDWF
ncbi:MAG: hypothetical protein ACLFR1_09845 [Spirochaetia bacterium]